MKIPLGRVTCPDWLDYPLMVLIALVYLTFIIGLALAYSPWWLLLGLLGFPSFKRIKKDTDAIK